MESAYNRGRTSKFAKSLREAGHTFAAAHFRLRSLSGDCHLEVPRFALPDAFYTAYI
ncbi:hypothetical protein HMPREF3213_01233 [Heyndrickxia coagulans]|uniref:Uncharacterized protein n=1 Tax=Heyndrickxia coagulans TaxID=1398 RepID=A0A0C5CG42_HEYCO|nr:hypothetical protein SB48_HM08orf06066 [Heyndrickxia coagulans]KWZ83457.1 hypothetical protein HMPREF3213_01233 [Heyndrickxia coagulans]